VALLFVVRLCVNGKRGLFLEAGHGCADGRKRVPGRVLKALHQWGSTMGEAFTGNVLRSAAAAGSPGNEPQAAVEGSDDVA
jgi:hypothetical protein